VKIILKHSCYCLPAAPFPTTITQEHMEHSEHSEHTEKLEYEEHRNIKVSD